jgi:hypothetical protein
MYKFKNSLIAFGGLSLLIGAIAVATPRPTQGQGGDPVGPPKPVEVVNTPTVNAQQSGAWNVALTGTPIVKIDPTANNVTFAPRGTSLVFDSGLVNYPSGTGPTLIGPIDIRSYSQIRVGVSHLGPSDIDVAVRTALVTAPPVIIENSFRLDDFSVEDNVGSIARNGPTVSRLYEVAGTTLFVYLFFRDGAHDVRVAVFGS